MKSKSNFFQKQVGIKPALFDFLRDGVLRNLGNAVDTKTGDFDGNMLKAALSNIHILRSLIDWKDTKEEYIKLDKWLDMKVLTGVSNAELFWIITEKMSIFMRIAKEGNPDLLIDDEREGGGYIDEKGVFHDSFKDH
jgi:hypothetical protein